MAAKFHTCDVQTTEAMFNRIHMIFHSIGVIILLYYRFTLLPTLGLSWALLTIADLIMGFMWALSRAFRWRPIIRSVESYESILTAELPCVDVFICTADPVKEPVVEVMNTVISAVALDYPPEKLAVYLSDDGGAPVTKEAIKEAFEFGKIWVPFCSKYRVKTRCPEAFFSPFCDGERLDWNEEYKFEELVIKSKYEAFKKKVEIVSEDKSKCTVVNDRPSRVEIINDNRQNGENDVKMPLLVYASREKRPTHPHRFKGGALNALLRISGLLSNGPYLLVLDCDMYCNDPTSARQAMCFHLDPQMAPTLAFVQYPQIFYNASKNDIYDGQARSAYKTEWQGMDGLRGPILTGTGYYIKRRALYGRPHKEDEFLAQPEKAFGTSSIFIASLSENSKQNVRLPRNELLKEAKDLATCTYETNTLWGQEIGYSYECLLESTFTGYLLHCKGWNSVYLYPKRPCFLGCTNMDMKDAMTQLTKWISGLTGIGISKFNPFTYAMSRMSISQSMCYAFFIFSAMYVISFFIYGIVIPICLLKGTPIFPKVSEPWSWVFIGVFASSMFKHLYEVLSSGFSVQTWCNELRMWIITAVTASFFAMLDVMTKKIGLQKANFRLTNKVVDKEKLEKYEKGKFDFQGAALFMVPLILLVLLNLVAFVGGLTRVIIHKNYDEMFAQLLLSFLLLALSYPILEGIVTEARKGRA